MKKLLALLLTAVVLFTLIGCEPSSRSTETETESETQAKTETETQKATETQTQKATEKETQNTTSKFPTFPGINLDEMAKPVIYLYPEEVTEVSVRLKIDGHLTHTYPKYGDGWTVVAHPDGTLTDDAEREYYCLFWEGVPTEPYQITSGYVVSGEETEAFLEDTLAALGLTDKEANEFIIYWLPQMQNNAYNLISFDTSAYEQIAKLEITPTPDSILRVFMTWKALDAPIEIAPETLPSFEREGFTVVEWGGCRIN